MGSRRCYPFPSCGGFAPFGPRGSSNGWWGTVGHFGAAAGDHRLTARWGVPFTVTEHQLRTGLGPQRVAGGCLLPDHGTSAVGDHVAHRKGQEVLRGKLFGQPGAERPGLAVHDLCRQRAVPLYLAPGRLCLQCLRSWVSHFKVRDQLLSGTAPHDDGAVHGPCPPPDAVRGQRVWLARGCRAFGPVCRDGCPVRPRSRGQAPRRPAMDSRFVGGEGLRGRNQPGQPGCRLGAGRHSWQLGRRRAGKWLGRVFQAGRQGIVPKRRARQFGLLMDCEVG